MTRCVNALLNTNRSRCALELRNDHVNSIAQQHDSEIEAIRDHSEHVGREKDQDFFLVESFPYFGRVCTKQREQLRSAASFQKSVAYTVFLEDLPVRGVRHRSLWLCITDFVTQIFHASEPRAGDQLHCANAWLD